MNELCSRKVPFFFICDFTGDRVEVIPLYELQEHDIFCSNPLFSNASRRTYGKNTTLQWKKYPMAFNEYSRQFEKVMSEINRGNTYLLNLTCATQVETGCTMEELFYRSDAKYKLYFKDQFVHFSPEPFVKISGNIISSYPMKGTIDADEEDAGKKIMESKKEIAEQYIIVDLIRNDLSIVARNVKVEDFRYIEEIITNEKKLLAVSSKISGDIKEEYASRIGDIFSALLPAGSICGAPKKKTVEIILQTESHVRGWYTGVWGIFDGKDTDSCVIIRYLEKQDDHFIFKSGGGITALSEVTAEYREMIDKVYAPVS